jgi:hypothetical protein
MNQTEIQSCRSIMLGIGAPVKRSFPEARENGDMLKSAPGK